MDILVLLVMKVDRKGGRESVMNFVSHKLVDTRAESVYVSMSHIQM